MTTTNLSTLSEFELTELATEALGMLPLNVRIQAVLKAFDSEEREELANWVETPEEDDE